MEQEFTPVVGMGATLVCPQDRYPYVITRVSPSGKTVWLKPVATVSRDTGHEPARFDGPFPVWSHEYTPEELQALVWKDAAEVQVRVGAKSSDFRIGTARYHRNYSY